ncbi:MAG: integrase core domain-containing protein [Candidatus Limnocylindria bacterium]
MGPELAAREGARRIDLRRNSGSRHGKNVYIRRRRFHACARPRPRPRRRSNDHSRLTYSELHADERAATVTGFVERGLAFYAAHGIESKRLLSDNAFVYRRNRSLRELLAERGIRHLLIPIRRPQVNGKVESYQQTLKREWALGHIHRSSDHRAQALSHWLSHYNERRPHSSLGGRSPISRVHNLPRQDI